MSQQQQYYYPQSIPAPRSKSKAVAVVASIGLVVMTAAFVATVLTPRAPQPCLDALDDADRGFSLVSDAIDSASKLDPAGIRYAAGQVDELAPTYNAEKAACRALG